MIKVIVFLVRRFSSLGGWPVNPSIDTLVPFWYRSVSIRDIAYLDTPKTQLTILPPLHTRLLTRTTLALDIRHPKPGPRISPLIPELRIRSCRRFHATVNAKSLFPISSLSSEWTFSMSIRKFPRDA